MTPKQSPGRLSRRTWAIFGVILVATLIPDAFVHRHGRFGADGLPLFGAAFGFLSCVVLVLVSKLLIGRLLQRPDDYHGDA